MPYTEEILKYLKPYVEETKRLHKDIEWLQTINKGLVEEMSSKERRINELIVEHEDSRLKRDKPLKPKWKMIGEYKKHVVNMCPVCEMMISNWQPYCHRCGQRIQEGNLDPNLEVKGNGNP